jgi:hypothetical protein
MDHINYQEQISQFIDNELPEKDSPAFFAHLSMCEKCREFLQEALRLRSQLQTKSLTVPLQFDQSIRKNLLRRSKTDLENQSFLKHIWGRRLTLSYPVVATALIIGITLGVLATDNVINTQPTPSVVYISTIPECEVVAPGNTH